MGSRDYFKLHDFNVICDVCGFKFKGSELIKRWDGLMVCREDWEPRPQQEYIRGIKETFSTPYSRPEPQDRFAVQGYNDSYALNARLISSVKLPASSIYYVPPIPSSELAIVDDTAIVDVGIVGQDTDNGNYIFIAEESVADDAVAG